MANNDKIEPETLQELEDKADRELLKELELIQERISNHKSKNQGEKITEITNAVNGLFKAVMQMLVPQVTEIKKSVGEFEAFQQKISDEISELKSENLKVKSENVALRNRITQLELQNSEMTLMEF